MDGTESGWRARWASRENARRRRAYEDTVEAWCLRGVRLQRLRAAAEDIPGRTRAGVPVDLPDDENVILVQPSTGLIQVPAVDDTVPPVPELSVIPVERAEPEARPPRGLRVVDAGIAVVTDRRLLLLGRKDDREWTYAELSGLAHDGSVPITLLYTHDGEVAGLRVPLGSAARFRLRLTLAYADATGQRGAVLARLDEAVAANRQSRPAAPVVATAEQAPARARLARPALAAASMLFVALAFATMTGSEAQYRPPTALPAHGGIPAVLATPSPATEVGPAASSAPEPPGTTTTPGTDPEAGAEGQILRPVGLVVPLPAATATARNPRDVPPAPAPGPVDRPRRPSPTPSAPASPTPSAPTPTDRCGAPENPYGYNYCGGALVFEPAADVCSYFVCVDGFWAGEGYLIRCGDGTVGMVSGKIGTCPDRQGRKDPVYGMAPASDDRPVSRGHGRLTGG
ncbi:hypothetical protein [Micromonospora rhizosphaerae]|uniref:hypothetical protein n=1 Tax=Micromonospora rhizosphaerae TaxID=568872 RepID=UPI000B8783B3|nr:hypothetical protein [Micromonospora rhizosphaerae]